MSNAIKASPNNRIGSFFEPQSIAVVGASEKRSFASNILGNLRRWGFKGEIYPVNPNFQQIQGLRCYPSLVDIPDTVSLALIGVNSQLVPNVLNDCEIKGVKAVAIVSSGFADLGGEIGNQRQAELATWANRTGIAVSGPNCLGLMNAHNGMIALPTPFQNMIPGGVSAVVQSGMLAPSLLMPMLSREIGLRCIVSTGNQVDVDASEFISYLAEDSQTRVIACYIEQIKDANNFIAACNKAADLKKPIVMIKAGRSEGARRAALAHTGALVGSDNVVDAVLRKLGVIRVSTIDDLIECTAALHAKTLPRGNRIALVSPSGGVSSLVSDLSDPCRVNLPQPSISLAKKLRSAIPEFGAVGNPLDVTGQSVFDTDILRNSFNALAESGEYDLLVWARDFPAGMDLKGPVGKILNDVSSSHPDIPLLISSVVGGHMFDGLVPGEIMEQRVTALSGIPFLQGTASTLVGLSALTQYAEFQRYRNLDEVKSQTTFSSFLPAIAKLKEVGLSGVTEREGKLILALAGIPTTREFLACSAEEAVEAASKISGSVALKIESTDIPHKTEAKCVLLDLKLPEAINSGFSTVMKNAIEYKPNAEIRGVLVQEMVGEGVDMIVGMVRDDHFGPVVMIGLGGVLVEVYKDVQYLIPPLSKQNVRSALSRLRGFPMLAGVRGAPPADEEALVEAILRFSDFVIVAPKSLLEIDINPLRVLPIGQGVKVLDSLLVVEANLNTGEKPHA